MRGMRRMQGREFTSVEITKAPLVNQRGLCMESKNLQPVRCLDFLGGWPRHRTLNGTGKGGFILYTKTIHFSKPVQKCRENGLDNGT